MRVSALIALAAKQALEENPSLMGVRVSPIALEVPDVEAMAGELQRALGPQTYVVASAPGVAFQCKDRRCTAPDSRAAEQATEWRNTVQPAKGERLVYVSVEEHEKASGLRDCLLQLSEADLHGAFLSWSESPASGLPKGLSESLKTAQLVDGLSPAALCEFAQALLKEKERGKTETWEAVGKHLPLLGLMRDTSLGKANASDRLEANARLVRQVATGERRRAAVAPELAQVTSELRVALEESAPGLQRQALAKVDLGEVRTGLIQSRAKARTKKTTASKSEPAGKPSSTKEKERSPSAKEPRAAVAPTSPAPLLAAPGPAVGGAREPAPPATAKLPSGPPLPEGLTHLLVELLRSGGAAREWRVASDARQCLSTLPSTLREPSPAGDGGAVGALGAAFITWKERRQALVSAVSGGGEPGSAAARLLVAVERLLESPPLREAVHAYVDASRALYEAALASGEERLPRELLALETVTLRETGGVALRLLGPLHPLWLAQAVARAESSRAEAPGETARRLLLRAAKALPVGPPLWPGPSGESLALARPEAGLLVYERRPEAVGGAPLALLGERLLRRYLSLCPHASLGVRIAVMGGEASSLVEGLAEAAVEEPLLRLVEVYCPTAVTPSSQALLLMQEGRLRVRALPTDERRLWDEVRPHLVVRLVPPEPARQETAAALAPATGEETLHTEFEVYPGGLRAWVPLASQPLLARVEALYARASGQSPRGALLRELVARPLGPLLRVEGASQAVWQVAVGTGLGRRAPPEGQLLIHERLDDTTVCAVVSRDIRPASRALAEALQRVGVQEERPMALRGLASRLAGAGMGGLVSLLHSSEHLVAGGALALELQRRATGATATLLTPVQGTHYEALTGEPAERERSGALLLGCVLRGGALSFQVGYATLEPRTEVELNRGLLGGAVGARLSGVLATLELARGTGAAAVAARDLLGWLLWPTLAMEERASLELQLALREWRLASGEPEVVCLLPQALAGPRGRAYRLGKLPVLVLALDSELFGRLVLSQAG